MLHQQGRYAVRNPVHLLPERGKETLRLHRLPTGFLVQRRLKISCTHTNGSVAGETEATVKEIRRKASKIAPAYNKGALQYLPED